MKGSSTTQQDTGWGVIYRLNDLFREVEILAPSGKYNDWNYKLDRIFSNLCYKNNLDIKKNGGNKIVSIEFDEEAYDIKCWFDSQIAKCKKNMREASKNVPSTSDATKSKEYVIAKNELYKIIFKKEIWLRKYMQTLGLYLKEIEYNPAGAMFNR